MSDKLLEVKHPILSDEVLRSSRIKNDLIEKLESVIASYIEAYITCDTSHESYINQAQYESDWYTLRKLLQTHFPEVDTKELQENAKKNAFNFLIENEDLEEGTKEMNEVNEHTFFND